MWAGELDSAVSPARRQPVITAHAVPTATATFFLCCQDPITADNRTVVMKLRLIAS